VAEIAPAMGKHALVVCGSGSVSMDVLQQCLDESGIDVEIFRVKNEPDIPKI